MNFNMQVTLKPTDVTKNEGCGEVYGNGNIFAVGDCNYGCISNGDKNPSNWPLPPIPKISYPGEEQALHACVNVEIMDHNAHGGGEKKPMYNTWWPWGAGMFATSLGPHDACFVLAANEKKCSGYMVNWWWPAAIQKDLIEFTKVLECKNNIIGIAIWHFVHHTPVNLWGRGPFFPAV